MLSIHIDADDTDVYSKLDSKSKRLGQTFIAEALHSAFEILNQFEIKAAVFVVGKNLERNLQYINLLKTNIRNGHEIGNHSYSHAENFHKWSDKKKVKDIVAAHEIITDALKVKPRYFRGPGYSSSKGIQKKLLELNYKYDCTKIPLMYSSILNLYFKTTRNNKKTFPNILRLKDLNFALSKPQGKLEEIRIHPNKIWGVPTYSTTLFHLEYKKINISKNIEQIHTPFLFHAIDFLEFTDRDSRIPALRIDSSKRISIIKEILDTVKSNEK